MIERLKKTIPLIIILLLGLILRLYKINAPLADHHSWRQVDSAAVIRNLAFDGSDILHPQWNNLVPSNFKILPNPNRYFFEDFPLSFDVYPALILKMLGNNVAFLRLSSIFFTLLTIVFLYLLVTDLTTKPVGLITAFLYAVLPFSVFFTRGVFQEVPLNFYAISALFFLNRYLKKEKTGWFIGAILLNALLFLTKPYALVFLLPETVLFLCNKGFEVFKDKKVYAYFLASLIPFLLWWFWVRCFPEGLPYSTWLLNEGNIRFKGSFFYWIFGERLSMLMMGFWGVLFFGMGLFAFSKYQDSVFYAWLIALLVFVSVIAKGNVTHDYYQLPFLPVVAYFMAKGITFILKIQERFREKVMASVLVVALLSFSLAFSWYHVRDFYNLTSGIDLAGDYIDKNTPANSLVIAGDGADPTLLYNTNRQGWTVGYGSLYDNNKETIEKFLNDGADYYVTTTIEPIKGTTFYEYMKENYSVFKETDQFIIFELKD